MGISSDAYKATISASVPRKRDRSNTPISHEALELCGEWGKGLVFKGLTRAMSKHSVKYRIRLDCLYQSRLLNY